MERRNRNRILKIKKSDVEWTEEPRQIEETFHEHFADIFKSEGVQNLEEVLKVILRVITNANIDFLTKLVLEQEIREAIFSLNSKKAPGKDGLNGLFFHHAWDSIKNEIISAIKDLFEHDNILVEANETTIYLIPKLLQDEKFGQYRSINCCKFIYKVPILQTMKLKTT